MKYDTGQKKTKLCHELNTAHDLHCATGVGIIHMIHPSGEKKTKTYCQSGRTCIASGDLVKFEACYLWTTYITILRYEYDQLRPGTISCNLKEYPNRGRRIVS